MGQIAATVMDVAEIRAFDCLLPDDARSALVALRLAELMHLPVVGPDNYPLNYGFIVKGGRLVDPLSDLRHGRLPQPLVMRLVPELIAGEGIPTEEPLEVYDEEAEPLEITISEPRALRHDAGLDFPPDVRIDARVHREIEVFAEQDRHVECAGLLLGTVSAEGRERVIQIGAMIPATDAEGSRTSVRITLESWENVLRARDEEYPDLAILGWFHTHAGWGVFLSDPDVYIHRHFFPHPNMVAYVIDPTAARDGFFYWHDGKISMCPSYGVVSSLEGSAQRKIGRKRRWLRLDARDGIIAGLLAVSLYLTFAGPIGERRAEPPHVRKVPPVAAPVKPKIEQEERVYVLGRGENLWIVCNRVYKNGALARKLAAYNGLKDETSLQVGQQVRLPAREVLEKR